MGEDPRELEHACNAARVVVRARRLLRAVIVRSEHDDLVRVTGHAGQRRGQFTWRARYDEFRTAPIQSICIRMGMREIDATVITFQPRLRRRRPRAHVEAHFAAYHNFRRKRSMRFRQLLAHERRQNVIRHCLYLASRQGC